MQKYQKGEENIPSNFKWGMLEELYVFKKEDEIKTNYVFKKALRSLNKMWLGPYLDLQGWKIPLPSTVPVRVGIH